MNHIPPSEYYNPSVSTRHIRTWFSRSEHYWKQIHTMQSLQLFSRVQTGVQAYKKFTLANHIASGAIRGYKNFLKVPVMDKARYLRKYRFSELLWQSATHPSYVLTATSGSTGEPVYIARTASLDWQYSVIAEQFLKQGPPGSTLLLNCFGLGVWIGGMITYQAFQYASVRKCPITILNTGVNKTEIFHCLERIAPGFDTVILAGYPPFIKDTIDEAQKQGISFTKFRTRFVFAAESFSEEFRDYVVSASRVRNPYTDTMNIYGSAELGAMAFETPASILIRRLAISSPDLLTALFGRIGQPTLAQYDPSWIQFDDENGELAITADAAMPLIRYRIGDSGGVLWLSDIIRLCGAHGINLKHEARKARVALMNLPFVFVHERSDFSKKLYGAIIYPEHIKPTLLHPKLQRSATGRFALQTIFDKKQNPRLEINIELKAGVTAGQRLKKLCQDLITKELLVRNAEFAYLHGSLANKVLPRIILWPYGHARYFGGVSKQKWTIK